MNSEIEKRLWKKAEKYIRYLRIVPFLKMVAVCNNLAFGKVDEKSDIDLFIIAKTGRLFIVRTFVTLILHILRVRRHDDKVAGRFCLSFFVDEEGMNMKRIALDNDIYLAFWMKTMVPLIDDGVSGDFIRKNIWMGKYFDDALELRKKKIIKSESVVKNIFKWVFEGWFGSKIENVLKNWQTNRAKRKILKVDKEIASLIVEDHILKFHNVDRRKEYRKKWFDLYSPSVKLTKKKMLSLDIK